MGVTQSYDALFTIWDDQYLDLVHRGIGDYATTFVDFLSSLSLAPPLIDEIVAASRIRKRALESEARPLAGFRVPSAYEVLPAHASEHSEANATTPALFCHGRHDPTVPMFAGQAACESARRSGREVRWYDFPIGHEVSMPEIQTIAGWLRERLPPT